MAHKANTTLKVIQKLQEMETQKLNIGAFGDAG
jgi:hypothetical protein